MFLKRIIVFFLILYFFTEPVFSQPCTKIVSGHRILTPTTGCVPFNFQIENLYSNSTPDTEYRVDWGDGTVEVLMGSLDPIDFTPDFSHTYLPSTSNTNCGYQVVIEATNACTDPEDARFEVTISVWDTDQLGLAISPSVINVCQGNAAVVDFSDATDWNCNPKTANENNGQRHIQWEYLGGAIDVPPAGTAGPVIPIAGTGTASDPVSVPAIDPNTGAPYNIGDEFVVRLNYWNYCNPYDDPNTSYAPDAAAGDPGETPPVTTTARVRIVAAPDPNFKIFDVGGAESYGFCIGDALHPRPDAAGLRYNWEFYDDEFGTTLLDTRTGDSPSFSFSSGGRKLVRLRVRHRNVVGSCETVSERVVNVFPVAQAAINVTDLSDAGISPVFCGNSSAGINEVVKFHDASLNADANTRWRWEFYDENNTLYRTEPASAGGSAFTETYSAPGVYRVKLVLWDVTVPQCTSEDEVFVYVYEDPQADFSFNVSCSNEVEFLDNSDLATSINGDRILSWEWDFDYDGVSFSVDRDFSGSIPASFSHDFGAAGVYQVALRVTTEKGGCQDIAVNTVEVKPAAVADFTPDVVSGCAPLEVNFTNLSEALQPPGVAVAEYRWMIDQGSGFVVAETQDPSDPSFSDVYTRTFANNTTALKTYQVKLITETTDNCEVESAVETIEVYPTIHTSVSSDYNPLNDNCSPLSVNFEAVLLDPSLSPDQFRWTIEDVGGVVKDTSISGTGEFDHDFVNLGSSVKNYRVTMTAAKSGYCFPPSYQNIALSPTPSSDFDATLVKEECNFVVYRLTAAQSGLRYQWRINSVDYISETFEISFPRPESHEPDESVAVQLSTLDPNTNCSGAVTVKNILVPRKESVNAALGVSGPQSGCAPFATQFVNQSTNYAGGTFFEVWVSKDGAPYEKATPVSGIVDNQFTLSFASAGVYQVEIRANTPSGCVFASTPSQVVTVYGLPEASFEMDKNAGCAPLQVSFTNNSVANDGANSGWYVRASPAAAFEKFSDDQHPFHTFFNDQNGDINYEVLYIAETQHGCRDSLVKEVRVAPGVKPDFMISPTNQGCTPLQLTFNNMALRANTTYAWSWGDGEANDTTELESQLTHTFVNASPSAVKTYNVSLTAENNISGCAATVSKPVRVYPDIQIAATPDATEGCSPLNVNFSNESVGASDHVWYYRLKGSGEKLEIISAETVGYNFENKTEETQVYEIVYEASNSFGCLKSATFDIVVYPELKASFTANPQQQTLPNSTVTIFNGTNEGDWEYNWDFGDGTGFSSEKNPEKYTYETYGVYEIKLVVKNGPCESDYSRMIVIDPVPPVVDFTCDPKRGCRPLTVRFKNLSTFADSDSYSWDFGDNQGASTAKDPVYTYNEPGVYSVSLTASNKLGKKVVTEKKYLIEVYDNPYAKFEVRPKEVYIPDMPVNVTNFTFGADEYWWDFGDGSTYAEYEPEHYYSEAGAYDITLVAKNDQGCADTVVVDAAAIAIEGGNVKIPNVFTPSPDGPSGGVIDVSNTNDIFMPVAEGVVEFHMQIFNRWGQMLFETYNKEVGWDGYYNGRLCQQDVYIYKISMTFADGRQTVKAGDVTLLR